MSKTMKVLNLIMFNANIIIIINRRHFSHIEKHIGVRRGTRLHMFLFCLYN